MKIGARLHAPDGCLFFPKGYELHLLANTVDPCRVLLVHFTVKLGKHGHTPQKATLVQVARESFEDACMRGLIQPTTEQLEYPSWVDLHGPTYTRLDRPANESVVKYRLEQVLIAVRRWKEILTSRDPGAAIAVIARDIGTNVGRYRLMVLSFMLFGQNEAALSPCFPNCGRWDRLESQGTSKLGRPSIAFGEHYGVRMSAEQLERIVSSYRKHKRLGRSRATIYERAMRRDWGCTFVNVGCTKALVHPEGLPFPTPRQFDYHLLKVVGVKQMQIDRYGAERARNRLDGNKGAFSAECANLLEVVEFDAFTVEGYPVGVDHSDLPPLYVVRARDRVSGMFVGIGFSFASEKQTAYEMAHFCMSISKVRFCSFRAIKIEEHEWPCIGMSGGSVIYDRGPGAGVIGAAPMRELSPSYAGQSKASIETSHQKNDDVSGPPSFVSSGKNPVELAAAVILETIAANGTMNVSSRLTPKMKMECDVPTPLAIWDNLDRRGRNVGVSVPFDQAVRKRLVKLTVVCTADGVEYKGFRFSSDALTASGLTAKAKRRRFEMTAYVMPCCVRQIWIDHRGRLMELQMTLPIATSDRERDMTLAELDIVARRSSLLDSRMTIAVPAERIAAADRHYQTFGKELDTSKRKPGRVKHRTVRAKDAGLIFHDKRIE